MNQRGKTIRSEGHLSIVEELAIYADGTSSVVGYFVLDSNDNASPLLSEAQAQSTFEDLLQQTKKHKPPSPGS